MNNNKKIIIMHCLLTTFTLLFIKQNSMAGADWKGKQEEMFSQIPVKVGDVINSSNWEKITDLVPEQFLHVVKSGDWILKIGEFKYDHDFDSGYYELSAKNNGKYGLGRDKEIIDLATGKYPMFVEGMPFPEIDVENDPDGATKVMHNNSLSFLMQGTFSNPKSPERGTLQWIGRNTGYERGIGMISERVCYWNRLDGQISNPREYKQTIIPYVIFPFDLLGTATLYVRHLDGRPDSVYAYVPAIRRVKRLSGANRSDPQMGSDMCMDDGTGFAGQVESMKWSFIDKKIILKPTWYQDAKETRKLKKNKNGAYKINKIQSNDTSTDIGCDKEGWSGAPWAYTNLVWIPRETYILKAVPKDPFYAYGAVEIYVDKLTYEVSFNIKYSKAGEYWKYVVQSAGVVTFPNGRNLFNVDGPMCVVDVKTDHASIIKSDSHEYIWNSPRVKPQNHTPQNLRVMGK